MSNVFFSFVLFFVGFDPLGACCWSVPSDRMLAIVQELATFLGNPVVLRSPIHFSQNEFLIPVSKTTERIFMAVII